MSTRARARPHAHLTPQDIGFWAGVMLLINNITGPGIPQLPNLLAESGWLTPLLCAAH